MDGGGDAKGRAHTFVTILKLLAIVANITMASVGAYGFYLGFHTFNTQQQVDLVLVLISLYMALFGMMGLGAELKARVLYGKFGFLSSRLGRAIFYLIIGSLATVQGIQTAYCTAFVEDMPSCPAPFCTPTNGGPPFGLADQCKGAEICYKNGCVPGCAANYYEGNQTHPPYGKCKNVPNCDLAVPALENHKKPFATAFFVCVMTPNPMVPTYEGDICKNEAPCIAGTSCPLNTAVPRCKVDNDVDLNPLQSRCCAFIDKEKFTLASGCVQMIVAMLLLLSFSVVPSGSHGQYNAQQRRLQPLLSPEGEQVGVDGRSSPTTRGSDDEDEDGEM